MRYGSVCSGVEAASLAWEPLGWEPQWFAEIEKFPAAVLNHHWPRVENLGDTTDDHFIQRAGAIDVLVGGTPCQSFSVAGLRGGLGDDRGNLALRFCQIVDQLTPTWVVWENVPGVLSSNGGRDFGAILGALVECGYGFAYRILDAQYFGVAQRRRRVFVVGYLGDWRPPAAVLFERYSLLGHTEESAEKRQEAAEDVGGGAAYQCYEWHNQDSRIREESVASTLSINAGGKEGNLVQRVAAPHVVGSLLARDYKGPSGRDMDSSKLVPTGHTDMQIRRLTPIECERLQGMPNNHTRIPWRGKPAEECPDGPRYKAIGNSMAVPVMRWIGQRIDKVDNLVRGNTPTAGGFDNIPKGMPSSNERQPPAKILNIEQGTML